MDPNQQDPNQPAPVTDGMGDDSSQMPVSDVPASEPTPAPESVPAPDSAPTGGMEVPPPPPATEGDMGQPQDNGSDPSSQPA